MSQSLRFIYTAIYSGVYRDIFERRTLSEGLIAGVFVLNLTLRKRDVEAFEDMPLAHVLCPLPHRLALIIKCCKFSSVDVQLFAPQLLYILLA